MKKLFILFAFLGLTASQAMAQETEVPTKKYSVATNSFWANWFISAGISGNSFYTSQETSGMNGNPFSDKRGTLGFTVAVGKWFTPGIGLRTKFEGIWGKQVNSDNNHPLYNMVSLHEDVMFNLSNMFCGYNEKRVWNFIPYVGIGWVCNMEGAKNANEISYHFGLLNNFRVSKRIQVFFDLNVAAYEGSLDKAQPDNWDADNHGKNTLRHWDKKVGLDLGVTYNLGKCNWEKTPDVDALMAMNKEQMDALNQSLKDQQDENARLRDLLAAEKNKKPVVTTQTTKELVGTAASVFFNINSSKIASRKDLVNVKELAEYAKNNNAKIVVTGYADSKTGSSEYNKKLSLKRAETVANELAKMGVNRDNIVVEGQGGVNSLSPFSYNRRATVKLQ